MILKPLIKSKPLKPLYKFLTTYKDSLAYKGKTKLNVLDAFPAFVANGWGYYDKRAELTMQCINQVIPALLDICQSEDHNGFSVILLDEIAEKYQLPSENKELLSKVFNSYGSDKASTHDYYAIYSELFEKPAEVQKVFEIGLGTNNTDIVSTMGKSGIPGASLRAFRDYFTNAQVFGADFDKRILFEEERIKTFFVDQTDIGTFLDLSNKIGEGFDLMIDDGLHAPNANLHSLKFFLPRIRVGGYAIIEDICPKTKEIWKLVSKVLGQNYSSAFFEMKSACIFVVKRLA